MLRCFGKTFCGHGLVVEHVLAKDEIRVRFPVPAQINREYRLCSVVTHNFLLKICSTPPRTVVLRLAHCKRKSPLNKRVIFIYLQCALGRNRTYNNGFEDRCDIHFTTSAEYDNNTLN